MSQRTKGKVRFSLKDSKVSLEKNKSKESLIMLHFNYGDLRFKYSVGYSSSYNNWDFKKQRIRNRADVLNSTYINDLLNDIENLVYKEVARLDSEQLPVNKKVIKTSLDTFLNKLTTSAKKELSFYEYVDMFIDRKKGKIADVTLRSYKQTKRLLKEFNSKFDFEHIDLDLYYSFLQFLEDDDKSLNTIGKHIKNWKSFLKSATEEGYNKSMTYTNSEFKAPKELTTAIYLDNDELKKIMNYDLSKYPELERARDIFLIGCFIGQRVSDYNGLTEANMVNIDGVDFFKIRQAKTKNEVLCPITKDIKKIMKKHSNLPPKKMLEQDINDHIKQVGQMANISEVIVKESTRGGKQLKEKMSKYELICTHTARRSFCTNMYKKGMPIYDIMEISGHSTEKEFYKYIRIEKEKKAVSIAKSGYFNM